MKIKFLCYILFFSPAVHAQISYGIKGGLNISDVVMNNIIDPDAESDFNLKIGFHSGVFVSADLNDNWGAMAEFLYSVKGIRGVDTNVNLNYMTLPLLIQYSITENFKAQGGIEVGYMISARSRYGNVGNIWNNKLDLGLDLGLQYIIAKKINLDLRFNAGVSSVIDSFQYRDPNGQPNGNRVKYQNRVLQLSIGYALGKIDL